MKLLKNIVRVLALASLSLPLTPLTTAKAAEATPITVSSTDPSTEAASDGTITDSKTSTVNVTVLSGILTLDAVPDFNFGNISLGSTVKLKSNVATGSAEDGNSKGLLQVTDSRNLTAKEDIPGFTLTAKMSPLVSQDSQTSLDAILDLNPVPLLDADNNNVSSSSSNLFTKSASLDSSKTGTTSTVINLDKGSYNPGVVKANFNTPDSASMTLPKDSNINYDKSSKDMNAVVTWTLTAKPTVTTN
ncbi:MAG TPA: WxL domain-containing protein [Candidatus Companilactobacillus pullicola]|uniref:WxL domain-containing protein n=1 Tax=Candidatus Companilactobacillus pullicola TaxID=2838523 RepID=A0A9D2CMG1_9LACO|nr:WxL domain-containing protein [Candidatus Companilactobacillus pullicola]